MTERKPRDGSGRLKMAVCAREGRDGWKLFEQTSEGSLPTVSVVPGGGINSGGSTQITHDVLKMGEKKFKEIGK